MTSKGSVLFPELAAAATNNACMEGDDGILRSNMDNFQKSKVSKMEWKTYEQCIKVIRPYNLEKKHVLEKIHKSLQDYKIIY